MQVNLVAVIGLGVTVASGCGNAPGSADAQKREVPELGTLYAAVEVSEVQDGVTGVRLDIVPLDGDCEEEPLASELVSLANTSTPGAGGVHAFANGLFILDVGSYRVCATPLDGETSSAVCARTDTTVEVQAQATTEAALVSQCVSTSQGGIDVVVSLNQEPIITKIELAPSKYISACESLNAIATAQDPNEDALSYAWTVAGPEGSNLLTSGSSANFSGPSGDYELTLEVSDGHGGTSQLAFPVHISAADCEADTTPPPPATGLQAAIESRRETSVRLSWTPPNETVAGYDIAYVAVDAGDTTTAVTDANFDMLTHASDVAGGSTTTLIHDLMIEQRYLFGVRPYDTAGNTGPVVATTVPLRAQFETLVMAPPFTSPPGTQWGYSVDASTDLDGDGTADLVVGQKYGDLVSIYLGQAGGTYASNPTTIIIGPPASGFGSSVAVVGNIVGDSYEDIAIAAPEDGPILGRVYVVSGRAWTSGTIDLTDGNNPTGSIIDFPTTTPFPAHVVRLGDFDGDDDGDFGIHALGYANQGPCDPDTFENCDGALLLIKGKSDAADFPNMVSVPNNTSFFEAYVPSSLGFYGGDWLLGITDLIGGRSGVLAAEYQAGIQRIITRDTTNPNGFTAQLLEYGPPAYTGDTLTYDTEIGTYPGALTGNSTLAIQLTNARDGLGATPGIVDVYALSATNTFALPLKTFKAAGETNNFGQILIGNRFSGRPSTYNLPFFGRDAEAPSLIMGGRRYANKLPKLFMVGPDTLAATPANPAGQELTGVADVEYFLAEVPGVNPDWVDALGVPSDDADWQGGLGFAIHDMDNDGFADIGVAEWDIEGDYTGGIIILH